MPNISAIYVGTKSAVVTFDTISVELTSQGLYRLFSSTMGAVQLSTNLIASYTVRISSRFIAEGFLKSFCLRVKVNIFDGHFKDGIPVIAAAPFGLTYVNPVGCLVTDALEAVTFHKGFQQINGMSVLLYPV